MVDPAQSADAEYPFSLPHGFRDPEGTLHREGSMRMATAFDELAPLKDPRVQSNPGYLVVVLLARVVTRLGNLDYINPKLIEGMMACDFIYLQEMYRRINEQGHNRLLVSCPHCRGEFEVEASGLGES